MKDVNWVTLMKQIVRFALTLGLLSLSSGAQADKTTLTLMPGLSAEYQRNFNPFNPNGVKTTRDFIFEPLFIFDDETIHYRLARYHFLSDDLTTLSIHLRTKVSWSDGTPFTADDVIFSLSLLKQHPELDDESISHWIKNITKVSDHKLHIHLHKPNSMFAQLLARSPIVPKHQWETIKAPAHFTNPNPIGTGPFTKIEGFNENNVIQCANPYYWQKNKLAIDCIQSPRVETNDELINRIRTGEFDWSTAFIPDIERNYAAYSPDFHYHVKPTSIVSLLFNFKHKNPAVQALFNTRDFRRAVSMSINRNLLINVALFDQGKKTLHASGMEARFSHWLEKYAVDQHLFFVREQLKTSKRLLDNLGLKDKNQDGTRELPNGDPLLLTIISPLGWTDFNSTAGLIADMLTSVGIKTQVKAFDFDVYTQKMANAEYDLSITNYFTGSTPFRYFDEGFNSQRQTPDSHRYAHHFFQSPRIDNLLHEFLQQPTLDKQKQTAQKIHLEIAEQQITVPLYHKLETIKFSTMRFTGWRLTNNGRSDVPSTWDRMRLVQLLELKPNLPHVRIFSLPSL